MNNSSNNTLFVFVYIVLTVYLVSKTYVVGNHEEALDERYVENVHNHIAATMMFHLLVAAVVIIAKPAQLGSIYVIAANTLLSILFSVLYYRTPNTATSRLYGFNTMYLVFASILFADAVMYFENPTYVKAFALVFAAFLYDTHFYSREDRKKIIFALIIAGVFGGFALAYANDDFRWVHSTVACTLYATLVLGYMYYDHDTLVSQTPRDTALNAALKYFLDVEGTVVRMSKSYIDDDD